jgi:hypothetical protein
MPGPERKRNVSLSAASMARASGVRREKPGDTKAGAPRVMEGHCRLATVTWRFKDSGYATLLGSNRFRDLSKLSVIGRERQRPIAPA